MTKLLARTTYNLPSLQGFNQGFTSPPGEPISRFGLIVSNVITVFTIFAGLAFLFYFIIGAVNWISSAGKPDLLEKAKSQMSSAIVGLIVVVLTIPLTYILAKLTGLDILNPITIVNNLLPN